MSNTFRHQGNAVEKYFDILSYTLQSGYDELNKAQLTLSRMWGKVNETHALLVGVQSCTSILEINVVGPQESEKLFTSRCTCTILGHTQRALNPPKETPVHLFNHVYCALFMIERN